MDNLFSLLAFWHKAKANGNLTEDKNNATHSHSESFDENWNRNPKVCECYASSVGLCVPVRRDMVRTWFSYINGDKFIIIIYARACFVC